MRLRTIILLIALLFPVFLTYGSPARKGVHFLMQPDGTAVPAIIRGDEFSRIKTTVDGHAIVQDSEGWWCYARYRSDGTKENSGWRVGQDAPSQVLSQSQSIPYASISDSATRLRRSTPAPSRRRLYSTDEDNTQNGIRHGIVLLVQFQDVRFTNTREDFMNLLMQEGYTMHGATGSAKEYFDDQFKGRLSFAFDVSEIVTLANKREFYGKNGSDGNDENPHKMIEAACLAACEAGTDFSIYDQDNDGYVDNVFVFFAGEDEAEGADENCIWSHAWYLFHGAGITLNLNGKMIDRYACASELTRIYNETTGRLESTRISGIGTFCHEYSHTLGLPDLYDTDYDEEGGWAAGLWGSTSLMDSGNHNNHGNTPPNFNAIEREILGIADISVIDKGGTYTLAPVDLAGECLRLDSDRDGEYYLIECRSDKSDGWDAYIGGSGMLVYHIDRTDEVIDRWWTHNNVNSDSSHQCADLVEADGRKDSFTDYTDLIARQKNISGIFFPYGQTNFLTPEDVLKFWSGEEGRFSIMNIEKFGNGSISFKAMGDSEETTPPYVRNTIDHETFYDGAIVLFESSRPFGGEAVVRYGRPAQDTTTVMLPPYKDGRYSIILEGLESAKTYFVSMAFVINDIEGKSKSISFMTKKQPVIDWPYIFFGSARRNSNGTFLIGSRIPLKVNNASDAKEITWSFNGKEIQAEGDNYFTIPEDGTLKAHVIWEDGREEILMKDITLSPMTIE